LVVWSTAKSAGNNCQHLDKVVNGPGGLGIRPKVLADANENQGVQCVVQVDLHSDSFHLGHTTKFGSSVKKNSEKIFCGVSSLLSAFPAALRGRLRGLVLGRVRAARQIPTQGNGFCPVNHPRPFIDLESGKLALAEQMANPAVSAAC